MPRYVFVIHARDETHAGIPRELPDLDAARREAVRALTEVAKDELPNDGDTQSICISVADEQGRELLIASLEFQISDRGPGRASGYDKPIA